MSEPTRKSARKNLGVPPGRFNSYDMTLSHSPIKNGGGPATSDQEANNGTATVANTSAASTSSTSTASAATTSAGSSTPASFTATTTPNRAKTTPATKSVLTAEDVSRDLQKKMLLLQANFQQQLNALQGVLASNMEIIKNELRRIPTAQNTTPVPPYEQNNPTNFQTISSNTHPTPSNIMSQQQQVQQNTTPNTEFTSLHRQASFGDSSQARSINPHKKIYPLPIFTGAPEEWPSFYESFTSTTQEFEYSNLHNIMRLRDALKGKARDTVESLLSSSDNIFAILDILQQTFGRPEQLIKSQIEKVRSLPAVMEGNLDSLVNYANKITNMSTFVKNVNGVHHLANPMLLSELVSKLPVARQMQWAEKCILLERTATILDFSTWLSTLRRLANMVNDSLPSSSSGQSNQPPRNRQHTQNHPPTTRKFAGVSVAPPKCPICQKDCTAVHECKLFLSLPVDERWKRVKSLKHCFSCLKGGHQVQQCFFKSKLCGTNGCTRVHHKLLHATNSLSQHSQTSNTFHTTTTENAIAQPGARNCHAMSVSNGILFQIVPIKLHIDGNQIKTYAFVDDGANVSMIDRDFAKCLGLSENEPRWSFGGSMTGAHVRNQRLWNLLLVEWSQIRPFSQLIIFTCQKIYPFQHRVAT